MNAVTVPRGLSLLVGLLTVLAIIIILYLGRDILIPLVFAALLATLLNPVYEMLMRFHLPRTLAISITVLIAVAVVVGITWFIVTQVSRLSEDMPRLATQLDEHVEGLQRWIQETFNISTTRQVQWIRARTASALEHGPGMLGEAFLAIVGLLTVLILVPIYVFLFLYYKRLFIESCYRIITRGANKKVNEGMEETREVINKFLVGLMWETLIVAAMNVTALLILGIDYAVLLGVIGALLNLIPYIGSIIAYVLPTIMALITKDSMWYAVGVIGVGFLVQFIDANIIIPRVVGSRVRLNALVSLVVVFVGATIWGLPGMFLALPMVAVLKVIFDRVDGLKPWGMLFGSEIQGPVRSRVKAA